MLSTTASEFIHLESFWRVDSLHKPKQLMLLDIGYVVDNILPQFQGEKCVMLLVILAVTGIGIWTTQKKGWYDNAKFSHCDLILYFKHQLRVIIRCDRKCLACITFDRRWVHTASLGQRWSNPTLLFLSMELQTGSFGTPTPVNGNTFSLVSSMLGVIVLII